MEKASEHVFCRNSSCGHFILGFNLNVCLGEKIMAKKSLEDLLNLCNSVWGMVDEFCGDKIVDSDRAVIFGAVGKKLLYVKRKEVPERQEKPKEDPIPVEKKKKGLKKEPCTDKFNPEKSSKCFVECKENSPEEYGKCLEKFQENVVKKAKVKPKEERKGRTFDKDFWGFDKTAITGKINEMISKKLTSRNAIAEHLGIDSKRVAVHLSNLKNAGFVVKKKKNEDGVLLYKLTKEKSE
jgi:biotin operon repressor